MPKDTWDKWEICAKVVGALLVPVMLVALTLVVDSRLKSREIEAQKLGWAIGVLQNPEEGAFYADTLRPWALEVLQEDWPDAPGGLPNWVAERRIAVPTLSPQAFQRILHPPPPPPTNTRVTEVSPHRVGIAVDLGNIAPGQYYLDWVKRREGENWAVVGFGPAVNGTQDFVFSFLRADETYEFSAYLLDRWGNASSLAPIVGARTPAVSGDSPR